MLYRSRNSGRDFWWNQPPCWPVLTPISCTKLKIHSAHASGQIVPKQVFFLGRQFGRETSLCFTDQETQEEIFGGTSPLVGQFLHPSLVQSSRSIQLMQAVKLLLNKFFFLAGNLEERPVYALQIRKLRKRIFGGTSSLVGQFLHPSPVQSSRSIQLMQVVKLFLNKFFFLAGNLEERPVYALQIRKLRKRFLVEPAPLWASSYTHLLYKAQDPFSSCKWSNCS